MARKKFPKRASKNREPSLQIHSKSLFAANLTKAQIIFSSIVIVIMFTALGFFFFATKTGIILRLEDYDSLLQVENDLTQNLPSARINIPLPTVKPSQTIIH